MKPKRILSVILSLIMLSSPAFVLDFSAFAGYVKTEGNSVVIQPLSRLPGRRINTVSSIRIKNKSREFIYKDSLPDIEVLDSYNRVISPSYYTKVYYFYNGSSDVISAVDKVGLYKVKIQLKKNSPYCNTGAYVCFKVLPGKTDLNKVKSGKKCFTAYWSKMNCVDGYELQYNTSKSKLKKSKGKKVNIKKDSFVKKKIKKLKKKKKYYVRVRSYKTFDGKKKYGKWSSIKKVKTK